MVHSLFQGKKALITGGLGFIGSNLARALKGLGAQVSIVDSLLPEGGGNLFNIEDIKDGVKVSILDIGNEKVISDLVLGQDFIFNLAAQVGHLESMEDPLTDLDINCRGQLVLLETCRHFNPKVKIVFASTRQVYGKSQYLPVDEKHPLFPPDINGIHKLAGERYHLLYHNIYGIRTVVLRLTNVYGPGQVMKHEKHGFIARFIKSVIDDKNFAIYSPGTQLRDLNYVDDAVEAFLLAGASEKADGEIFNLGHPQPISVLDTAKLLIRLSGKGKFTLVSPNLERKRIDIGDYYGDFSKIKKTLGWEPKTSLREGLKKTLKYYEKYKKYYWQ